MTVRRNTTETLDELIELSEEEVFSKIIPVNAACAAPGAADTVT